VADASSSPPTSLPPKIAEAYKLGRVPRLDLAVADEAHRCVGRASGEFATVLDEEAIPARRRLFMTATPRYFTGRVSCGYSTPTGFDLGTWCAKRRQARRDGRLSAERIDTLNALGFVWSDPRKERTRLEVSKPSAGLCTVSFSVVASGIETSNILMQDVS
jgi:hypothetical protein